MIGNIGSSEHLDYSIIGPTVNLAARLCGHAQPDTIIVSNAVREAARSSNDLSFLDPREVHVRGVSEKVQIFRLVVERARAQSTSAGKAILPE